MKIYKVGSLPEFEVNGFKGSQAPTPLITKDNIKLSFTARKDGKSYCFSYYLDKTDPLKIVGVEENPEFSPGDPGSYYSDGFMISQHFIEKQTKQNIIYFTGWEDMNKPQARYRVCCGIVNPNLNIPAVPFIDRTAVAPCGSSMPFRENNEFYYMAVDKWEDGENFYSIASWYKTAQGFTINTSIVDRLETEGGLARPVKFIENIEGRADHIMFCARGKKNFRTDPSETYKPWLASYIIHEGWKRVGELSFEGEDGLMVAYPYPLKIDNQWFIFYNNTFTGSIQIAKMDVR